ncbi:MAG: toprim domain-containing protein, partial [Chloroflexota bacterium]|nr:toprim domain-containing protein [Chloroflexota bacterium]
MAKDLVIVESPTKARTIERILGDKHTVMASLGHVRDLPVRGLGVDIERDFEPRYVVESGDGRRGRGGRGRQSKADLVEEIAAAAGKAATVYLATDPDREGEAISWHLLEALRERKVVPKNTQRVVFHEIT